MIHPRRIRLLRRTIFIAFLSAALLLAVSLGLRHRIMHGASGDWYAAHAQHSCAAFDSASLGDRLATSRLQFGCLAAPALSNCASIPATWQAPPAVPFSARAPPRLLVVFTAHSTAPTHIQLRD